jgi:16S rRNA (uracil1498-N3)-methyltransferase
VFTNHLALFTKHCSIMAYFFIKEKDIENDTIRIKGKEYKHIKNVLRLKVGDRIILTKGDGEEYHSIISNIRPSYIKAKVARRTRKTNEPLMYVAVAIAPSKGKRMEWFVEKATEIGVSEIIPIITRRGVTDPGKGKLSRWRRISVSAMKQSERSILPKIREVSRFDDLITLSYSFPYKFIAYKKEKKQTIEKYLEGKHAKRVLVVVGPEGGFEEEEIEKAVDGGFLSVSLGITKLRIETAGVVAVSRILACGK